MRPGLIVQRGPSVTVQILECVVGPNAHDRDVPHA
jgi:hypothetical protein